MFDGIAETQNWNREITSGGRCRLTFDVLLSVCRIDNRQCASTEVECRSFQTAARNQTGERDIIISASPAGLWACAVSLSVAL